MWTERRSRLRFGTLVSSRITSAPLYLAKQISAPRRRKGFWPKILFFTQRVGHVNVEVRLQLDKSATEPSHRLTIAVLSEHFWCMTSPSTQLTRT